MGLVTGDGVAPDGLDQTLLDPVIAATPVAVERDMIVEVALVDVVALGLVLAPADDVAVLGAHGGREASLVLVPHVAELEEHAVDDAEVVPVLDADDLLGPAASSLAGRVDVLDPGGALHGHVELDAGRVAPADDLAAAQHPVGRHVGASHLPDEGVVLAVGDGPTFAGHGGQPDNRALARLAVDLGQHHVWRGLGEGALALDRR